MIDSTLNKTIKGFWDLQHHSKRKASLSGCLYEETIKFLQVADHIKAGCTVLEIGVGLGYVTKGFFENGVKVSAVDISEIGLERVKGFCEKVYNVTDVSKLPTDYFDVIICHNVVQHVPTDLLIEELKEFMRSLKVGGVFAVEFVSSNLFSDNGKDPSYSDMQAGRLCRTPAFLESIFNRFGGKCKLVYAVDYRGKKTVSFLHNCYIFHVTK